MVASNAGAVEPCRPASRHRLPGRERRRQLLALATRSFARHGYHETTLDQIARQAGISGPAIYRHFTSKEGLFRAAIAEAPNALLEHWRLIEAVAPASDWLEAMGAHYEAQLGVGCWSLALQLQAASHSPATRGLVHRNTARLHDFIRQTALAARAAGALHPLIDVDAVATEFISQPIRRHVEQLVGIEHA